MPLLDVKGLTKQFGGLTAVNKVDFSMEEHEIASVIGPNGAGKTTFFNIISGYYTDYSGIIEFDGKQMVKMSPERVASCKIARTFQNIRLFKEMLVIENVLIGYIMQMKANIFDIIFRLPRMRHEESGAISKAMEILDYVGLGGKEEDLANSLSYGQQRRLEIARALAIEPKLLMLDEPAAGLNPKETEQMTRFILKLRDDKNTIILLIEHDMKLVMGLSDTITVLNYGERIAKGTPDEIRANESVINAYLGQGDETAGNVVEATH